MDNTQSARIAAIQRAHPECVHWYRIALLPRHLIGQHADGTYRAYGLHGPRQDVDVFPMPHHLVPLTMSITGMTAPATDTE